MIASVIIDIKNSNTDKLFDYWIPECFQGFLEIGMRVIVPFGNQKRLAYVILIKAESAVLNLKEIVEVVDITPIISKEVFKIIDYLLKTTTASYAKIINTVIPLEFVYQYKKEIVLLKKDFDFDFKEKFNSKGRWHLKKSDNIYFGKLKILEQKGVVQIETKLEEKESSKLVTYYKYNTDNNYQKLSKYQEVLNSFNQQEERTKKDLIELGLKETSIKTLVLNNVLIVTKKAVNREINHLFKLEEKRVDLNPEQEHVYQEIKNNLNNYLTYLIKGITGSGKTEVYLKLAAEVIKNGKSVIILVPEITLIAPLLKRVKAQFLNTAVISSSLSGGTRYDEWQKIRAQKIDIVVGTRSAIFVPITNIGLIIIDEEHESSYFQTEKLEYDTKEIATIRAKTHNIPLVLGSATPSINTYYKALNGDIKLLEINKMALVSKKPHIELVDMRLEIKSGNTSILAKSFITAIEKRLIKKEQVIILFNRKGYAPFVLCTNCGETKICPHCDIALTYYKYNNKLRCHYCGYEEDYNSTCQKCLKPEMKEIGYGIEYLSEVLKQSFPSAKILRMDANTTRRKGSNEAIWHEFFSGNADILIGTKMIAKGLDFPNVTLVGVIMADMMLKYPSYRATEETYTLLSQAAGRSGRFKEGEVFIQCYQKEHFAIESVLKGYEYFYHKAIYTRKEGLYEPFGFINQIVVSGSKYLDTYKRAFQLATALKKALLNIEILGPSTAIIGKIRDHYRFTVTIKYQRFDFIILDVIKKTIKSLESKELLISYNRFIGDFI